MRRYFVIESPEQLKSVSDPLRIRLLTMLIYREATGKQLADELQMSASKIHYHLHELESNGVVSVVRTEEKNGIVQKFYRAVAIDFVVSDSLLPSGQLDPSVMQEVMANQLRMALSRVHETDEVFFQGTSAGDAQTLPLIHGIWEVKADRNALLAWKEKFHLLMKELNDIDQSTQPEQADDHGFHAETFFLTTIGFLTDKESFQVDDPGTPAGFRLQVHPLTGEVTARREEADDDADTD